MANPTMTREAREAFLADIHVGILSVNEPGRGPCTVPVWYQYKPGGAVRMTVGPTSRKVELMRAEGRATLCVQTETPPYKYVTVEGPVELVATDAGALQREIALRYLGEKNGERYLAATAPELGQELLVTLRPERWWSADFSQLELG